MTATLDVLFTIWIVMAVCAVGISALAVWDTVVTPWRQRRRDVRIARAAWRRVVTDEPSPAFVASLRERVVRETREWNEAQR